jgi:tRNA(Arg) A34 adenosine deaminase TadA
MWNHDHFMGLALEQARKAYSCSEVPVGAVLVDDEGQVLGSAHNASITLCDPTAHGEILALRQASAVMQNYRLPGTTLYVTLEPCVMCLGAMLHARVQQLIYGTPDPKAGAAGSVMDLTSVPVFNHHIRVTSGVRARECSDLLKRFFGQRR